MPLRGTLRSDPSNLLVNANAGLCKRPKYIPLFIYVFRILYDIYSFCTTWIWGDNMRNTNLQAMIESAILAAFAMVIDILPLSIKLPTGGSISFAMIPIFIIAYRWGFKSAFLGGLVWGLLQIVVGDAYILTPVQAFIEYFIAFAFIGFAGLFYRPIQKHF